MRPKILVTRTKVGLLVTAQLNYFFSYSLCGCVIVSVYWCSMNYKEENYMSKQSIFSFQLKKKKILLLQCKPTGTRKNENIYGGNKAGVF